MDNKIYLFYFNKESILNQFPYQLSELLNQITIIFDLQIDYNKFFDYFELYFLIYLSNENIQKFVLNNQKDMNEIINNNFNNIIKTKVFVLEKKKNLEILELKKKIEELNNKIKDIDYKYNIEINNLQKEIKKKNSPLKENKYKIHFFKNKILPIPKKFLNVNKSIKYLFKILYLGEEWPKNTFLRCIPDNNEIFFFPTKDKIIVEDYDNKNTFYYGFEVTILFKNINHIEKEIYSLKCELLDDKEGKIGDEDEYGSLSIQINDN